MQAQSIAALDFTHVIKLEEASNAAEDAIRAIMGTCYGGICVQCNDLCDYDLKCGEGHDICHKCIIAAGGPVCLVKACKGLLSPAVMAKSPFSGVRALSAI